MKALYCGSFDPLTFGHIDIIERASKMFDSLTIGVGENPSKKYMFTSAERAKLVRQVIDHVLPNNHIKVEVVSGLTADYARLHGYTHIIKGVRTTTDFDYERLIHDVSLSQQKKLETILLFSDNKLSHVSSSAAKELAKFQGMIHEYVPIRVKAEIEQKLGQVIVGVTGEIGSGKSTFCKTTVAKMIERESHTADSPKTHHVNLDVVGHMIFTDECSLAEETREQIRQFFGTHDRQKIGKQVFGDKNLLEVLNNIMREPMLTLLRQKLSGLKGTILLEGALLAESDWLYLCNNHVVLMETPNKDEHVRRLKLRGMDDEQIERRVVSQWNFEQKKDYIISKIDADNYGSLTVSSGYGTGKLIHKR